MTEPGRALLTDREREILSGEADVSDAYKSKTRTVVRTRVVERLPEDIELLEEHFGEAFDLAIDEVCDDG